MIWFNFDQASGFDALDVGVSSGVSVVCRWERRAGKARLTAATELVRIELLMDPRVVEEAEGGPKEQNGMEG